MGAPQPTYICRKFLGRGSGWVCDLGGSLSGGRLSQHTFADNSWGVGIDGYVLLVGA